jgi:hypothetical protein
MEPMQETGATPGAKSTPTIVMNVTPLKSA